MKNWTIGQRIITNSATLLALVILVGAVGINAVRQIESLVTQRLRDDAIPGINSMSGIINELLSCQFYAAMAGSTNDPDQLEKWLAVVDKSVADANVAYKSYEATITAPEDRENFAKLVKLRAENTAARKKYLELVQTGQRLDSEAFANGELNTIATAYRNQAQMMLKWNQDAAVTATGQVIAEAQSSKRLTLILATVALLIGVSFAVVLIRGLNRQLRALSGNLDDSAGQVASAAGQVSRSSQSLAEGSSEQAASLEETSSSLEELTSMTKRNADSAGAAKSLSGETRQAAEQGNNDMAEMREAMESIKTSSADIAKIIKTIDEIAFQTNILALNAAVEAARAGEAGMGFAVVAEEVRALAQRSAHSAKETASKIEVAIHNSEHGALISEKVATSLGVIVGKARRVDEIISEIATASTEQSQGISQINSSISEMDKVTQSNAGNAEETAAAAEELNAQSNVLKEAVSDLHRLVGGHSAVPQPVTPRLIAPSAQQPTIKTFRAGPVSTPASHSPTVNAVTIGGAPARALVPAGRPIRPTPLNSKLRAPIMQKGSDAASHDTFFKDA